MPQTFSTAHGSRTSEHRVLLPLEAALQRKQGLIQGVIRAMLVNQVKRDFDPDLLSSLGRWDVEFWGKGFAYNFPSEEAAVRHMAAKSGKAC